MLDLLVRQFEEEEKEAEREMDQLAERVDTQISEKIRDTLAAAYAEDGRFDDAVTEQERAIVMMRDAGQQEMIASAQSRLDLYRSGQPYRQ